MASNRYRDNDGNSEFPGNINVAEKNAQAQEDLARIKKSSGLKPVVMAGSTLASSWWGMSWNKNLEGYAEYSKRVVLGRSYVRCGAVMDLKIMPGEISALVQGSRAKPYTVTINISKITPAAWEDLKKACARKLASLPELLAGKFSRSLSEMFTERGTGLFPSPRDIRITCTCPERASMCKHVAAALYGVGARLDTDPGLFFKLRKVEVKDLVSETVQGKSQELLDKANKKSERVLEVAELAALFGVNMNKKPGVSSPPRRPVVPAARAVPPTPPTFPAPPAPEVPEVPRAQAAPKRKKHTPPKKAAPAAGQSSSDLVADMIRQSKDGVDAIELTHRTGLDLKGVRKILTKLKKEGRIINVARGVYMAG